MNELHEFLRSRRSVRRFKPDSVEDSVIERILTTATYAPSAHNLQPWRFVIVKSQPAREELSQTLITALRHDMQQVGTDEQEIAKRVESSVRRMQHAPVIILLCRDTSAVRTNSCEETTMGIQSVAAAGLQLAFAAHAEGLGANWICWPLFVAPATRVALNLADSWEPQAMFFLGSISPSLATTERSPLSAVLAIR